MVRTSLSFRIIDQHRFCLAKLFVSRVKRCRLNRNDFETIKIIGRGAFGEGKISIDSKANILVFSF